VKKIIDFILLIVSFILIFSGIYFYKKSNIEVNVKCKTKAIEKHIDLIPKLNSYTYYKNTIIGKLLPKEFKEENNNRIQDLDDFLLMGTVIIQNNKGAVFFFKKDKKCQPYKIGEEIEGWKIEDIQNGTVTLKDNNKIKIVKITDQKVSCSKIRITKTSKGSTPSKAIFMPLSSIEPGKPIKQKNSIKNKKRNETKTNFFKAKKKTFLEILKEAKENNKKFKPKHIKNPFLEILKHKK